MPALAASSAKARRLCGVSSDVFITTALPAASAGANFQAAVIIGKFQGTIAPTMP